MQNTYKIKELEQVRLLADPLKLKLLQAFAESAKTAKQVAAETGERVTKLYRHVDALLDAGLLVVVREQQKRGTVERTFRAVAGRFEVDHSLFRGQAGDDGAEAARKLLRTTESEIVDILANGGDERAIMMRFRGKASTDRIAELRATLETWLESLPQDEDPPSQDTSEFGGLIAFYKID